MLRSRVIIAFTACLTFASAQEPSTGIERYRQELKANPRSSIAHFRLGEIFMQENNLQAAANEFREALNGDLQPAWVEAQAHQKLGRIFNMTGQYDRAARQLKTTPRLATLEPAPPTGVYSVSEAVAPVLMEKTEPEYSEEARAAGLEGAVSLSVIVGENGTAREIKVSDSLGLGLDEKAIEAVKQWRFQPGAHDGKRAAVMIPVDVDFRLPSKQSRWHLIGVEFDRGNASTRPVFLQTTYPEGVGISGNAIDQGRILSAIGRVGTARISFDVDVSGEPVNLEVKKFSDLTWAIEAPALVRRWRFSPGAKDGLAVPSSCTVDLIWGPRTLTVATLGWAKNQLAMGDPGPLPWETTYKPGIPRIHVSADVQATKLISKSFPDNPETVNQIGPVAKVRFRALIGTDGHVAAFRVLSGKPSLVDSAAIALKKWVYEETLVNGKAAEVETDVEVEFAK